VKVIVEIQLTVKNKLQEMKNTTDMCSFQIALSSSNQKLQLNIDLASLTNNEILCNDKWQ